MHKVFELINTIVGKSERSEESNTSTTTKSPAFYARKWEEKGEFFI